MNNVFKRRSSKDLGFIERFHNVYKINREYIAKQLNFSKISENSYGFRPNRNAHQAIKKAQECMKAGYRWVVDIDLEKYFDTVNHDKSNRTCRQGTEADKSMPEFRSDD